MPLSRVLRSPETNWILFLALWGGVRFPVFEYFADLSFSGIAEISETILLPSFGLARFLFSENFYRGTRRSSFVRGLNF
jgi:hypothetical protein